MRSLSSNLNRFLLSFEEVSGLKKDKPSVLPGLNCGVEVGWLSNSLDCLVSQHFTRNSTIHQIQRCQFHQLNPFESLLSKNNF